MDVTTVLALIITLLAGLLNVFLGFLVKLIWSEVKEIKEKQAKDVGNIYKYMREQQKEFDDALHKIKTEIIKLGHKISPNIENE